MGDVFVEAGPRQINLEGNEDCPDPGCGGQPLCIFHPLFTEIQANRN
jgi:hypothetical protein